MVEDWANYMPLDVSQVIENTKQYNIRTNATRNITQHQTYYQKTKIMIRNTN